MAKVTFVYPDFENLGIEYLMAVCLQNRHEVDYIYYQVDDAYLGLKRKEIPFKRIAERISKTRPDIAAFSCVTDNYQYQLSCARALKEISPDVITIFGGIHPTSVPEKVLKNREVDCIAVGEAENSFPDFLKRCTGERKFSLPDNPVKGIAFKKHGKIIGEFREGDLADLNELPFPYKKFSYSLFKSSYHEYRIMASRGCPNGCSYCFNSLIHRMRGGCVLRRRSSGSVIDELASAKKNNPFKYILFLDDAFTTNEEWIIDFCGRYKREIGLPFACVANPLYLNGKIIKALSSAGCINVQIGIQSLSEELCAKVLHRKTDRVKIEEVINELKLSGIMVQVDHILGIPGDTLKLQEESLLFYNKNRPDLIDVMWLTYYPKTPIVEMMRKKRVISDDDVSNLEEGIRIRDVSYHAGGDSSDPGPYCGVFFLLGHLPLLPKWVVSLLVRSRFYRALRIRNYFIAIAFPRIIQSIFNRRDYRGRSHIIRFIDKVFGRGPEKDAGFSMAESER